MKPKHPKPSPPMLLPAGRIEKTKAKFFPPGDPENRI
jgi:hypothetical protein